MLATLSCGAAIPTPPGRSVRGDDVLARGGPQLDHVGDLVVARPVAGRGIAGELAEPAEVRLLPYFGKRRRREVADAEPFVVRIDPDDIHLGIEIVQVDVVPGEAIH